MASIINWDKPQKIRPSKEHAGMYSSDSGVPGTYMPNMSDDDIKKWKGKVVGATTGSPQVEIRKDCMVIIVSLGGGYQYKFYKRERTTGINIHVSMAGPTQLTFAEWDEMKNVVEEARQKLLTLQA
jgi:hypothetical protein